MKEIVNIILEGFVTIFTIDKNGKRDLVLEKKNMILPNAKTILARCIAGVNYHIDNIVAYNSNVILASAPITVITYPDFNSVEFTAIFDYTDWSGVADELRLTSSIGGDFSQIIDLNITKDTTVQLGIVWKITFNDCAVFPVPPGDFSPDFDPDFGHPE